MQGATESSPEPGPYDDADLMDRALARAALNFDRAKEGSLLDFVSILNPRLIKPYHLAPLADAIERTRKEPVRLTISVPPRHGKTELLLCGIVWLLANDPSAMVAYVSYAASLARNKSRIARDYAQYAGLTPRDDANAAHEWLFPEGGGLRSSGLSGQLTGHGYQTIIIDDPQKDRQSAESRLIQQRNIEWFTSTASTRLTPTGSVIVCHTRWHENDLIGHLKKETDKYIRTRGEDGEWWEHVNLPAIDEDGDGYALCPELWPRHLLLRKKRAVGAYDWASLYQGEPRPRGARLFKMEPERYSFRDTTGRRIVIGVDVAGTASTKANWTVAVVMAFAGRGEDLRADVLEVHRWQVEIPQVCRNLEDLQKRYSGVPLVVEGSGIGKPVVQLLRETNPRLRLTAVYPVSDKWIRAQTYAAAWNDGRVRLPERGPRENDEFIRVTSAFTGVGDAEDDDVDAAAHAWNHMMGRVHIKDLGDVGETSRLGDARGFG